MVRQPIMLFVHNHKILLSVLSVIFIQLPPYIESIWSLIERISGTQTPTGSESLMSVTWLYWFTVPLGLAMLGVVLWLTKKPVLSKADKSKITDLMASVNALDDRMSRCFNELIYKRNRVSKYHHGLLESSDFKELWDKCSEQRANINVISPELGEQVRLLLMILQTSYSHLLKDWLVSELPKFEETIEEHVKITEAIRRRIRKTIEKLMG